MNLENIEINNIEQFQRRDGVIVLRFEMDDIGYSLRTRLMTYSGNFRPVGIVHRSLSDETKLCPFCERQVVTYSLCHTLKDHINDLFYRLISSKQLRLQWLYLPHD